jgi:hypothetical protein
MKIIFLLLIAILILVSCGDNQNVTTSLDKSKSQETDINVEEFYQLKNVNDSIAKLLVQYYDSTERVFAFYAATGSPDTIISSVQNINNKLRQLSQKRIWILDEFTYLSNWLIATSENQYIKEDSLKLSPILYRDTTNDDYTLLTIPLENLNHLDERYLTRCTFADENALYYSSIIDSVYAFRNKLNSQILSSYALTASQVQLFNDVELQNNQINEIIKFEKVFRSLIENHSISELDSYVIQVYLHRLSLPRKVLNENKLVDWQKINLGWLPVFYACCVIEGLKSDILLSELEVIRPAVKKLNVEYREYSKSKYK